MGPRSRHLRARRPFRRERLVLVVRVVWSDPGAGQPDLKTGQRFFHQGPDRCVEAHSRGVGGFQPAASRGRSRCSREDHPKCAVTTPASPGPVFAVPAFRSLPGCDDRLEPSCFTNDGSRAVCPMATRPGHKNSAAQATEVLRKHRQIISPFISLIDRHEPVVTGFSSTATVWPLAKVPSAEICPRLLIPVTYPSVRPVLAGITVFRSIIVPSL